MPSVGLSAAARAGLLLDPVVGPDRPPAFVKLAHCLQAILTSSVRHSRERRSWMGQQHRRPAFLAPFRRRDELDAANLLLAVKREEVVELALAVGIAVADAGPGET